MGLISSITFKLGFGILVEFKHVLLDKNIWLVKISSPYFVEKSTSFWVFTKVKEEKGG